MWGCNQLTELSHPCYNAQPVQGKGCQRTLRRCVRLLASRHSSASPVVVRRKAWSFYRRCRGLEQRMTSGVLGRAARQGAQ